MQKLLSVTKKNANLPFFNESENLVKLVTDLYQLPLEPLAAFIAVSKVNNVIANSFYSSIFIHSTNKKIFIYDIAQRMEEFDEKIYEYLTKKSEKECTFLFHTHGFWTISDSTHKFDLQLTMQGFESLPQQVLDSLDPKAIKTLKSIQLGIVPRLYNWLIEGNKKQQEYRTAALMQYPILLVGAMGPTIFEYYPKLKIPKSTIKKEESMFKIISRRIDEGENLESVLTSTFEVSAKQLAKIKGKSFHDITEINQPKSYAQFKNEIEAYRYLAKN